MSISQASIPTDSTRIRVNGDDISSSASTVAALLKERGIELDRKGIAVALNDTVVPRSSWEETDLHEGDRVEIISAMQGG